MSKPSKQVLIIAILGVLVAAFLAYNFMADKPVVDPAAPVAEGALTPEGTQPQASDQPAPPEIVPYDESKAEPWVKEALKERVLGKADAPVTIVDHSSLSCPHCADFHKDVLPLLYNDYIAPGKVKLVFSDFPLNLPALQASALSRCVKGDDEYFAYIDQLFSTQSSWSLTENARGNLLNTLKFTGLSREEAERCLDNQMLYSGLLAKMKESQDAHKIESTPSFVINGKEVIRGAQLYRNFKEAIDKELAK